MVIDEAMAVIDALELEDYELMALVTTALTRRGYAVKVFGPGDVERLLQSAEDNDGAGRDIAKIVEYVVEGEDWPIMGDVTNEDEANLYALIAGARNDHPEWFGSE